MAAILSWPQWVKIHLPNIIFQVTNRIHWQFSAASPLNTAHSSPIRGCLLWVQTPIYILPESIVMYATSCYTGGWFNIKMSSYQYRKSHSGDKTILHPSYLHNGISYTGKMISLYWIRALVPIIMAPNCIISLSYLTGVYRRSDKYECDSMNLTGIIQDLFLE